VPAPLLAAFGLLMAMALVWLVLVSNLFRALRERHPYTYREIGSPTLFLNNSILNNWLLLKFLVTGAWQQLGDQDLSRQCRFMRVFLIVYTVLFVAVTVGFFRCAPR
jgi:hypothetical protein